LTPLVPEASSKRQSREGVRLRAAAVGLKEDDTERFATSALFRAGGMGVLDMPSCCCSARCAITSASTTVIGGTVSRDSREDDLAAQ